MKSTNAAPNWSGERSHAQATLLLKPTPFPFHIMMLPAPLPSLMWCLWSHEYKYPHKFWVRPSQVLQRAIFGVGDQGQCGGWWQNLRQVLRGGAKLAANPAPFCRRICRGFVKTRGKTCEWLMLWTGRHSRGDPHLPRV